MIEAYVGLMPYNKTLFQHYIAVVSQYFWAAKCVIINGIAILLVETTPGR